MGSRYTEKFLYAMDDSGTVFKVSEEYHYAGGCVYKSIVEINGHEYEYKNLIASDEIETEGEELPILIVDDLKSYFTENPTNDIKKALNVSELSHLNISKFLIICIESGYSGPYFIGCYEVTKHGCDAHEYDNRNKVCIGKLEAISKLLSEYNQAND